MHPCQHQPHQHSDCWCAAAAGCCTHLIGKVRSHQHKGNVQRAALEEELQQAANRQSRESDRADGQATTGREAARSVHPHVVHGVCEPWHRAPASSSNQAASFTAECCPGALSTLNELNQQSTKCGICTCALSSSNAAKGTPLPPLFSSTDDRWGSQSRVCCHEHCVCSPCEQLLAG